mmetsp:Transcript_16134/g.22644  ORF Transcript_16134/g.22644 Transcript_16134/m.22644 type:complete len:304 (+) Transcript_16134:561-1472(+)
MLHSNIASAIGRGPIYVIEWKPGDSVWSNYKSERGIFPGVIEKVESDGTVFVQFDDGDTWPSAPAHVIRPSSYPELRWLSDERKHPTTPYKLRTDTVRAVNFMIDNDVVDGVMKNALKLLLELGPSHEETCKLLSYHFKPKALIDDRYVRKMMGFNCSACSSDKDLSIKLWSPFTRLAFRQFCNKKILEWDARRQFYWLGWEGTTVLPLIFATSKKSSRIVNSKKVRYRMKGCIKYGSKVGKWTLKCGRKVWCNGFIKMIHDDGTCLFLFEDGDETQNLFLHDVENSVASGPLGKTKQVKKMM